MNSVTEINIHKPGAAETLVKLIQTANKTVADDFALTRDNAPGHTSFLTVEKLLRNSRNKQYFLLKEKGEPAGCVVTEQNPNDATVYFIENLAVLPPFRQRGYGKALMEHALREIQLLKGKKASLGLIDENTVLKEWYLKLNFQIKGIKKFKNLPFQICFMEHLL